MEHAKIHDDAAERLITKILLDPALVENERTVQRAKLINSFMEVYGNFTRTCTECLPGIIYRSFATDEKNGT
jgi:hypothetical protein